MSGGRRNLPNAVILRIADIESAIRPDGYTVRSTQRRILGCDPVTVETVAAVAGDCRDLVCLQVDEPDGMVFGVDN